MSMEDVRAEYSAAREELLCAAELGETGRSLEAAAVRYREACAAYDAAVSE